MFQRTKKILFLAQQNKTQDDINISPETRNLPDDNISSKPINILLDIVPVPPTTPGDEKLNVCSTAEIEKKYGEECILPKYDDTNSCEIIPSTSYSKISDYTKISSGTLNLADHNVSSNSINVLSDIIIVPPALPGEERINASPNPEIRELYGKDCVLLNYDDTNSCEIVSSTSYSSNDGINDLNSVPLESEHEDSELDVAIPVISSIYFHEHTDQQMDVQDMEVQVEQTGKKNYKDRKDLCMFCERDVSHFARHLFTWHSAEFDVQRILSFAANSKERREALSVIRKQGNFIRNRTNNRLRPVKRVLKNSKPSIEDYLPCSHCFGFYKKKFLFRHTKRCSRNPESGIKGKRQTSQSNGHTTLLMSTLLKHDELLKNELFPRMRADEVNMVAKKDFLICNYGYSYLKGRRSKGNLDLVRQNMRRLAKLLKFARTKDESIKTLIDVLRPCHLNLIIEGVNQIACYNSDTDTYESPTLAMNFGTLLKKCCDLAYIHLVQKSDTNGQRKEVTILKTLIQSQWADEVSAQAATNLKEKKWNKNELIPLTTDLKRLNDFLQTTANENYNNLQLNINKQSAYTTLKEVLYCQIILLNRRRPAEVAQLKVKTYNSINLDDRQQDEFQNCLTETEKILLNSYTRIVIRGKRGRGVPILLSPDMRKHFDYLIEIRTNFVTNNDYVFHTAGNNFVDGTKVLYKYAKKCGIENPCSISATRLRKHLATVTQLLNFSKNDLEQLSNFMGHTLNTHCNFYRLPDNLYQTAKVSKLLLLMSQEGAEQFRGMQLDDINIDLEPLTSYEQPFGELLSQENELNSDLEDTTESENSKDSRPREIQRDNLKQKIIAEGKAKQKPDERINWTDYHKKIIATHFAENIKNKQAPKKLEVQKLIDTYPHLFDGKRWTSIKAVVYNIYTGKLKVSI